MFLLKKYYSCTAGTWHVRWRCGIARTRHCSIQYPKNTHILRSSVYLAGELQLFNVVSSVRVVIVGLKLPSQSSSFLCWHRTLVVVAGVPLRHPSRSTPRPMVAWRRSASSSCDWVSPSSSRITSCQPGMASSRVETPNYFNNSKV